MTPAAFAASPIGSGLTVTNGGLVLTTNADGQTLTTAARSTIGKSSGSADVEFVVMGDTDIAAVIGVITQAASLGTFVGGDAQGIGWRLDTRQVLRGNSVQASGLPEVAKGDVIGVHLNVGAGTVTFRLGGAVAWAGALPASGTWHFAASLAAAKAADLAIAVNAGQWQLQTGTGWLSAPPSVPRMFLADLDYLTAPTDAPANMRAEGIVLAGEFETLAALNFWPWGDSMQSGSAATLRVLDGDGVLDDLAMQDVSGVPVAVLSGRTDQTLAAMQPVARYLLDRIEVNDDVRKTAHLREPHPVMDRVINRGVFLPSIPALAWRPQPVVIGAVASAPALPANTDGSVLWIADAPLAAVGVVRDRGDAMEPGTWETAPDDQQLLMVSPIVGPATADVSTIGAASGDLLPATLQQLLTDLFARVGSRNWSATDAAALDAVAGYAGIGYASAEPVTVRTVLNAVLPSYGAGWWVDASGLIRFTRVIDPAAVAPVLDLEADETDAAVVLFNDEAPNLSRRMAYRPNAYVHQAADLVTDLVDVPPTLREQLMAPYRGQVYSAQPLAACYAHADAAAPMVSCFWHARDAQAELDRVLRVYAQPRRYYRWAQHLDTAPNPGDVVQARYPKYGLAAGKRLLVRAIQRAPATGRTIMTLWG